ncbi:dienelactone hydrolase family protein [soil metagenome]
MRTETISFSTANGDTTAFVALPDRLSGKAIVVIQEWWGLNPHIKDIAERYSAEGFIAIAPDLYRGKQAKDPEEAGQMMNALSLDDGLDTIRNSAAAARDKYDITKMGITGYCMGGTYALRAACVLDDFAAAAPFYGDVPENDVLEKLGVPTVFISATKDGWIDQEKVAGLEQVAKQFDLPLRSVKYNADHAFFNDTRPEVYDAAAAKDAWSLVIGFFNENLA